MADRAVIVSPRLMDTVLSNNDFFAQMPEFAHLKAVRNPVVPVSMPGCRSCNKRRIEHRVFSLFCESLLALSPERLAVFKKLANVESLQFQGLNRRTGKYEVKIL